MMQPRNLEWSSDNPKASQRASEQSTMFSYEYINCFSHGYHGLQYACLTTRVMTLHNNGSHTMYFSKYMQVDCGMQPACLTAQYSFDIQDIHVMVSSLGFIKGRVPGKLTSCGRDLAINLLGCFYLLFLLSFIRQTKNAG